MTSSLFLALRRLRRPLLTLIASYALCTLGLVLIPGVDAEGRPVHMDFMHAFYVISYTGSTIGYGEIPHAFTPAQRLWMIFTMYVTVTSWLYSIGSIITTLTAPAFRRLIAERRFQAQVRGIGQPFYLICGYGHTGSIVVRELRRYDFGVVVIDPDSDRLDALGLLDLGTAIPTLCGHANKPEMLVMAGLTSRWCMGVVALSSDQVNLAVAMAARLLNPAIPAICRTHSADIAANMASFGTRHIINPFVAFAQRVVLTYRAPSAHVVFEALTSSHRTPTAPLMQLPRGRWIVCGYGRFGQAVYEALRSQGNEVTVIESDPARATDLPGTVSGGGTEAPTLLAAGVAQACGIVAGTDHGINNLSIIVTARELQPQIFTIAREVDRDEELLFKHAGLHLRVRLAYLAATEAVEWLHNPLLPPFLDQLMGCEEGWAAALLARMVEIIGDVSPATWVATLTPTASPGISQWLDRDSPLPINVLLRDPRERGTPLPALALMVRRAGELILLPPAEFMLVLGDELLFCGRSDSQRRMQWALNDSAVVSYLVTGQERSRSWLRLGAKAP